MLMRTAFTNSAFCLLNWYLVALVVRINSGEMYLYASNDVLDVLRCNRSCNKRILGIMSLVVKLLSSL